MNFTPANGTIIRAAGMGNILTTGTITDDSVSTAKLQNGAVTAAKVAANVDTVTVLSVPAGVYGNSTFIPSITVSANGRISSISNSAVSGIDAHPFVFTAIGT